MKKKKEELYAIVDRVFDASWRAHFRWADSEKRTFTGHFETLDEAINNVPIKISKILVRYVDEYGKQVNKDICRVL